jgi:hypothetical protein
MSNFSLSIHQSGLSSQQTLLNDFRLAWISREASLLGRKEVLTGKAKFGIFGDGKELAQIAMARAFKKGDWRSGYYRDQTFMMAIGELTVRQYFAALYAHTDIQQEPASGGRQMGGHYATRTLDENGEWKNLMEMYNSSSDISPIYIKSLAADLPIPYFFNFFITLKCYSETEHIVPHIEAIRTVR